MPTQQKQAMPLVDDRHCFACGEANPQGLKLKFRITEGGIESEFTPSKLHQGFSGILHGGMMALVLDEMMVNLTWLKKLNAVTAEFTLSLKKPAPIGKKIRLTARILEHRRRIVRTEAAAVDESGQVLAEAGATCFRLKTGSS